MKKATGKAKKKIYFGSDCAGFDLKCILISHCEEMGYETVDCGCDNEAGCHYPEFAHKVCVNVREDKGSTGVLVCGTGVGMGMAANKHSGIRAAVCSDTYSARMTRAHNDANVLCLGARVVGAYLAIDILDAYLSSSFEGGRHAIRVDMINKFDDEE